MRIKCVTCTVIVLLYTLSVVPAVHKNSDFNASWSYEDPNQVTAPLTGSINGETYDGTTTTVDIEVCYVSKEGITERHIQKLPSDDLITLKEKISCETDPEKIISLLQDYDVIKKDITSEQLLYNLKSECPYIKERTTLDTLVIPIATANKNNMYMNANCAVISTGTMTFGIPLIIPLLGIVAPIGAFLSMFGVTLTDGALGGWYVYGYPMYTIILGFIGVWVNAMTIFHIIIGAAAFVAAGY